MCGRECNPECRYFEPAGCVLDLASEGPRSADEVAEILGVSRQRVTEIERVAVAKLRYRLSIVLSDEDAREKWAPLSALVKLDSMNKFTGRWCGFGFAARKRNDGGTLVEILSFRAWLETKPGLKQHLIKPRLTGNRT